MSQCVEGELKEKVLAAARACKAKGLRIVDYVELAVSDVAMAMVTFSNNTSKRFRVINGVVIDEATIGD